MGDNADDCYEGVLREMDDMEHDNQFFGCGPERPYYSHQPKKSRLMNEGIQRIGRNQQVLPIDVPENRDWKFIAIENSWPRGSRDFLVQQPDLKTAIKDFFENEWHSPFRHDKAVPDYHIDVQIQPAGGWIVYGETQTVLIFAR